MLLISQKTVDHQYNSQQSHYYTSGQKQNSYRQTNQRECKPDCTYSHGEVIKTNQTGNIQIKNPPYQINQGYKGQAGISQAKGSVEYHKNQKSNPGSRLIISGDGKRTQTIHYIDSKCPQSTSYKKKKQDNQSSETNGKTDGNNHQTDGNNHQTSSNNQKSDTSQASKNIKGGEALALLAVAVGGYFGSYLILKKSFQQEQQRPSYEDKKAAGNFIVHTACATGGALGGGMYGASIGAIAGPVGAFIGAGFGMLAGSTVGYGLKKIMPWNW